MVGPVAPVLDSNKEPSNTIDEKRIEAVLNNLANELTLNDKEKEELNKMTDAEKEIIQFRGNIKQDHIKKHKNNGVLTYGDLPVIAEKINSLDISNDEKDKLLEKYASGYKDVVNPITAMDSKDIKQPLIADVLKDQKMIRNTLVFTPITDDLEESSSDLVGVNSHDKDSAISSQSNYNPAIIDNFRRLVQDLPEDQQQKVLNRLIAKYKSNLKK